jgi:hypothetical protein
MTGNAKSEALEPRKLSSEELDAVAGGDAVNLDNAAAAQAHQNSLNQAQQAADNKNAAAAARGFKDLLSGIT